MGRRLHLKLAKGDSALVLRKDNTIEIAGQTNRPVLLYLSSVLFTDNKELVDAIKENYDKLMKAKELEFNQIEEE